MGIKRLAFLLLIFLFTPHTIYAGTLAFPGAEGFGANSVGGRGGTVYKVTNTNDSGTGSLRACVSASGPRICIFTVGGLITLNSSLTISNPYITIAGQTAPGGGITLKTASGGDVFSPKTHDIIIRYITARPGPGGENHAVQNASNNSTQLYNIIFDHCSFSWGVDSVWETWYRVFDSTIQWSFVNEGLDCSTHSKGCHSKGLMIGGYKQGESSSSKGSENISVLKNLMAHDGERTPLMQFCGTGQVINNVTYNPYWTFSHQEDNCIDKSVNSTVNWVGNYHKKGPDSTSNTDLKMIQEGAGVSRIFVQGNIGPSRPNNTLPDINWVDSGSRSFVVTTPASAPTVDTMDATVAFNEVLDNGGNSKGLDCGGNWVSRRDSIDARVVNDVKNGTGHIIDDPSEVGGWITPATGTPCADSDNDGIPNAYESVNPSGTIEDYINGVGGGSNSKTGDVNSDGKVNILDIGIVIDYFGSNASVKPEANLNGDTVINILDIGIIVDNYE